MKHQLSSPLGALILAEADAAIVSLTWGQITPRDPDRTIKISPLMARAEAQLRAYFTGDLRQFDLPLRVAGTEFQRAVCAEIAAIPYGETLTYGDIARRLGAPAQAVGQACGGNPIPVIIPCHRVLGATGLGGFSAQGGIETKVALLRLEGAASLLI